MCVKLLYAGFAGKSPIDFARCSMIQNCVTEVVYKVYDIYFEKDEAKKVSTDYSYQYGYLAIFFV